MKKTILSQKDSRLLEGVILHHGRIVQISDLMTIFQKEYSKASAHNRINTLTDAGWLRRLKRGLYLVIDSLTSRSSNDMSLAALANALVNDSYVSLSYALNFHQLFDQYGKAIVSVTTTKKSIFRFDDTTFTFLKMKKDMYFGFTDTFDGGRKIRIATAEKALIDYLYLDTSFQSASLVFEVLRDHHKELHLRTLQDFALRAGITIQRKIGFMLDAAGCDSSILYQAVRKNRGVSRFRRDSRDFNSKWRIYYDDRIFG